MRKPAAVATLISLALATAGCGRSDNAELAKARTEATAARQEAAVAKAELARERAGAKPAKGLVAEGKAVAEPRLQFDERDMLKPINDFREYQGLDVGKLPNCLDVLRKCVPVPFEGKTEEQYKTDVSKVAQQPCRIVLRIVDISADYDYAEFEILEDSGESGMDAWFQGKEGKVPPKNRRPFGGFGQFLFVGRFSSLLCGFKVSEIA